MDRNDGNSDHHFRTLTNTIQPDIMQSDWFLLLIELASIRHNGGGVEWLPFCKRHWGWAWRDLKTGRDQVEKKEKNQ
ncbi:hypothetical protein HNQ59_001830 [Chitinivorax tropicus]|uniref:Uncharacterized protein n=1 Tax=Chitinivorax tropicus TaxID=714531 RepID=A0A840MTL2_9PROT|nr:hypothetical protein [Chitinivorax tropicus]MBB5018541.1 hypothetical protein [Chitinivorax tropicus]